jgi:hypothetical protein
MNNRTKTVTFNAPKEKVFDYLSNIENLPKWATGFCRELKRTGKDYKVVTSEGEMYFWIDADKKSGVLDMFGGPSKDEAACWPARVAGLPDNTSVLIFTAVQLPGVPDETFEMQCRSLDGEFENIRRAVE